MENLPQHVIGHHGILMDCFLANRELSSVATCSWSILWYFTVFVYGIFQFPYHHLITGWWLEHLDYFSVQLGMS